MTENITTTNETTAAEPKSLPHMENITKAAELFGLTRYAVRVLAACTLAPDEGKSVIPAEPAEKPSFARPAKGIRRIG